MIARTRQIAIGGLVLIGFAAVVVGVYKEITELIALASTVVVGIVGILKQNENGGE